jgi:hypothetical protein
MGLDMYLTAELYVSEYNEKDKPLEEAIREATSGGLGKFRPKNVTFELAYWRKANAIHGWFVKNVQEGEDDCREYWVSLNKLKELKETCEKVLDNLSLANELLPTTKGFFFGDYRYDEYYEQDLERTVEVLDKILSCPQAKDWWIEYRSSW